MSTAAPEKKSTVIPAFGLEMDHPHNGDMVIQAIPGMARLRSRITANRMVTDRKSGQQMMPPDRAAGFAKYPEIPGMQLHVNPKEGTFKITDPLEKNQELLRRIEAQMQQNLALGKRQKLQAVPVRTEKIDPHRMKTLCREMVWMVNNGHARVVSGVCPTLNDVDAMDGRYLTNPGSRIQNTMPRYEDEMPGWLDQLSRTGG